MVAAAASLLPGFTLSLRGSVPGANRYTCGMYSMSNWSAIFPALRTFSFPTLALPANCSATLSTAGDSASQAGQCSLQKSTITGTLL